MVSEEEKYVHHYLDIYNVNIFVAVTPDQQKLLEADVKTHLNRKSVHKLPKGCAGAASAYTSNPKDGSPPGFILAFWIDKAQWIADGREPSRLAAVCAHEAAHGAGMLWNHIQGRFDWQTLEDEPMPYLIGWLTDFLVKITMGDDIINNNSEETK